MLTSIRLDSSRDFPPSHYRVHLDELNNQWHLRFSRQGSKRHTLLNHLNFIDDVITDGNEYHIVCSGEDRVVGTWTLTSNQESAQCNLLIYSSFAGQGFGKLVWLQAIRRAKETGHSKFMAGTHIGNIPMRSICEQSEMKISNYREGSPLAYVYFSLDLIDQPELRP